jgi:hypothetical protein
VESNGTSAETAALKKQIQTLQNLPVMNDAPPASALDALEKRVGSIENMLANLPQSNNNVTQRLTVVENAMKSLDVALSALSKRNDDIADDMSRLSAQADAAQKMAMQLRDSALAAKESSAAIDAAQVNGLQQRIAALEQSAKAVRTEIDKIGVMEKSTRLALTADTLRSVVVSGAPFQREFVQAKSLAADEKMLAPLEPFATSGVPRETALVQELRTLIPEIQKAIDAQTPAGGFLDRLKANADKLVRIHPVNAPPGDTPSDVLARLELAAAHADLSAALTEFKKLPEAARAPAQAWITKVQAREAALAAARSFAAETAHRLRAE